MFWIDLLLVLVFALAFAGILGWGFGWRHPSGGEPIAASLLFLFFILLLVMWAGVVWLPPWGPLIYGTAWLNILLVGLVVSLLILALATPPGRSRPNVPPRGGNTERIAAFGLFFWILIVVLLVAIVASYWA